MGKIITLSSDSESVKYLCQKDKRLEKVISMVGEITYQAYSNGKEFEFLVHEIIEQMLSIKAGEKIYERLQALCCGKNNPEMISTLTVEEIKGIGTSISKARSIKTVADAIIKSELDLKSLDTLSDDEVIKSLTKLHGIGMWTAKMFLIFALNRQDILTFEDVAFLQSYCWMYKTEDKSKNSVIRKCKKWKPYSSIAARYLYRALDMGFTKEEFRLGK